MKNKNQKTLLCITIFIFVLTKNKKAEGILIKGLAQ